jgi:hypothetical protein
LILKNIEVVASGTPTWVNERKFNDMSEEEKKLLWENIEEYRN